MTVVKIIIVNFYREVSLNLVDHFDHIWLIKISLKNKLQVH